MKERVGDRSSLILNIFSLRAISVRLFLIFSRDLLNGRKLLNMAE